MGILSDFLGKSNYVWNNPLHVFYSVFRRRAFAFFQMFSLRDEVGIDIPFDVYDRYEYFAKLLVDHKDDKDIVSLVQQEYRQWLKEHK